MFDSYHKGSQDTIILKNHSEHFEQNPIKPQIDSRNADLSMVRDQFLKRNDDINKLDRILENFQNKMLMKNEENYKLNTLIVSLTDELRNQK